MTAGSFYRSRDGESPSDPGACFGRFEDQRILGIRCAIEADRIDDGDPRALDMLGRPMRRGQVAIHISGMTPFGGRTGPGFVRELAIYRVDWLGNEERRASGFGCAGPEAGAIVTWDGGARGKESWPASHQRPEAWRHHAMFSACDGFVTIDGIYHWWTTGIRDADASLTPLAVCEELTRRADRSWCDFTDRQHVSAVRRLLDGMVGVSNPAGGTIVVDGRQAVLRRRARAGVRFYEWEQPATGRARGTEKK